MRLWLRARHVLHLVVVLVAVAIVQAVLGGRLVSVPVMVGTLGVSTWSMFLPVALGAAAADAMAAKTQGVEQRVARRVLAMDVVLVVLVVMTGSAALAALGGSHPHPAGTIGQVGIAVGSAVAATLGWGIGAGVLMPVALAITSLGYGLDAPAGSYVRVMTSDADPWWCLTLGVASLGTAVLMIVGRRTAIAFRPSARIAD